MRYGPPNEALQPNHIKYSYGRWFLSSYRDGERMERHARGTRPQPSSGKSPYDVKFASNYDEKAQSGWVSPLFSRIVYRTQVYDFFKAIYYVETIF